MPAYITVTVIPKSSRTEVAGRRGDDVLIKVTVAPEGGKANAAVLKELAKALGVPKTSLRIVRGETSRHKRIEAKSCLPDEIERFFEELPAC